MLQAIPNYFIKIDPKFLEMGYLEHHAKMLTYIANWQAWKVKSGKGKLFLSVGKIATDLNRSVATVYRWMEELRDFAIDRISETAKFTGAFFKKVFSYALSPLMPSKVEYDRETKSYQVIEPCPNSHDENINSHGENINSHDANPSIYINQSLKRSLKHPLTKTGQVGDVVLFSSLSNTEQPKHEILVDDPLEGISEETIDTPSSEPTVTEPLVVPKSSLDGGNVPAACDKPKPVKSQNKDTITSTEKYDYKVKLAAIDVAVQHVEWVIRQIPAPEREKVVISAIAWVSEQKWIKEPAAAFVNAVRTNKQPAAAVSEEVRKIVDEHKSESKQFAEWFDAGKIRGLVEQSTKDSKHYATVLITTKGVELLRQIQLEKDFVELNRLNQSDRDERLVEMERVELAGEVILPSYVGHPIPWQDARELLSCLTKKWVE